MGAAGYIYTSADSGVTWMQTGTSQTWMSVASSADGTKLVAVAHGYIHTSADSGRPGRRQAPAVVDVGGVVSRWHQTGRRSPRRLHLHVCGFGGDLDAERQFASLAVMASSADGKNLVAAVCDWSSSSG